MLRKQQDPGPQGQGNKMKKSLLREKARADAAVAARDRLALTNKRLKAGVCLLPLHSLWSFSSSLLVRSHARQDNARTGVCACDVMHVQSTGLACRVWARALTEVQ